MVVRHAATSKTPWKRWNTIMEVKFRWFSFSKGWFLGSMLIFRGVRTQPFCDFASKHISYNRESKTEPVTWMNSSPCNTKTGWHELLGEVPFPSCWMIYIYIFIHVKGCKVTSPRPAKRLAPDLETTHDSTWFYAILCKPAFVRGSGCHQEESMAGSEWTPPRFVKLKRQLKAGNAARCGTLKYHNVMLLVSILRKTRCKNPSWLVWHMSVMDGFPTYRLLAKPVLTRHNRTNLVRDWRNWIITPPKLKKLFAPEKGTFSKEKDHLPTIHFQGRSVKLRGCNILYKAPQLLKSLQCQ